MEIKRRDLLGAGAAIGLGTATRSVLELAAAGVPHEGDGHPNAVHGFNCDATPERYNKAAADLAWQRTIDWFNKYVRG